MIGLSRHLILLAAVFSLGLTGASGQAPRLPLTVPPEAILVRDEANLGLKATLDRRYESLRARHATWLQRGKNFNGTYVGRDFPEGSPEALAGAAEAAWLARERADYGRDIARFNGEVRGLRVDLAAARREMTALAGRLPNWTPEEVDRARQVMTDVRRDGDRAVTIEDQATVWARIRGRDGDATFAALAAAGAGPALHGIGTQSFEDCTIFALAAATGRPYGVVAALAGELVRENTARGQADRDDPEGAIKRSGLNIYDIILLTEALGQAELVPRGKFARTLREGRAVMVDLAVPLAGGTDVAHHEVVLSRTFRHEDEDWFEVIDSNLGVNGRHYVSEGELITILRENGIACRPDDRRTVPLLRP